VTWAKHADTSALADQASTAGELPTSSAAKAGEDNRNVARMSALLAGLPPAIGGSTVNRLCGSGLDAVGTAARAIRSGDAELMIAGGVESMSRAPFVMPKSESAYSRNAEIHDTTIGWRFINPAMRAVICPLLGGPKYMLFWTRKEKTNAIQETHAGGDYRQAA
jgi:acetyl-CoA acetyltransferase